MFNLLLVMYLTLHLVLYFLKQVNQVGNQLLGRLWYFYATDTQWIRVNSSQVGSLSGNKATLSLPMAFTNSSSYVGSVSFMFSGSSTYTSNIAVQDVAIEPKDSSQIFVYAADKIKGYILIGY